MKPLEWIWTLLSLAPLRAMYLVSDLLFYPFYYIARYRRQVVRRNLTESFPALEREQLRGVERRFYRFFLDTICEMCKMATLSGRRMRERMRFVNIADIRQVLAGGKSIALYLGHCGNWEWIASMPLHLPEDVVAGQVYHRLGNRAVNALLLRQRERFGAECIEMRRTARRLKQLADRKQVAIVGLIADQSPRRAQIRDHVPFLNHRTPVSDATEKLAGHFGLEAWYLDVTRTKRGYYEAHFVRMEGEDRTAEYYRLLERTILRAPELYLWTHNRFKYAD